MKKIATTFGLLSGLIIILYSSVVFLVFGDFSKMTPEDFSKVEMLGYLRYLILLLTIVFCIRYFKKQHPGEETFKRLFLNGFYTALIVALMVGLMEMVYMLVNPDFMEQYAAMTIKQMKEQGAGADKLLDFEKKMESMKWMANPASMGAFYFLETAVIGTVLSAMVALILRTNQRQPALG